MYTKIHWLTQPNPQGGKLGTSARPRGGEWLEDEIKHFAKQGVQHIYSLLTPSEIRELSLQKEGIYCDKHGLQYNEYAIVDRGIPEHQELFKKLVRRCVRKIETGTCLLIHCRMGIGRASLLAAGILIHQGIPKQEVFDYIEKIRGLQVPDTSEQREWLINLMIQISLNKKVKK